MKRALALVLAAATLAVAGCETATPYQPLSAHNPKASGGYSDQQLDTNHWRVAFAGNSLTSRETVERYLLYRAAELSLAQGYDWFAATNRSTDKTTSTYVDPLYTGWGGYWGPRWGLYRRGLGWRYGYWGDPFWGPPGPVDVTQVSQFQASADVEMGRGQKPEARGAFDARSVIEHLGPSIQRPTAG